MLDAAAAEEDGTTAAAAAAAAVLDPFAMIAADADTDTSFTAPPEEGAFTVGPPSPRKTTGTGSFSMSALQAGTGATAATAATVTAARRLSGGSQGGGSSCGASFEP